MKKSVDAGRNRIARELMRQEGWDSGAGPRDAEPARRSGASAAFRSRGAI